MVWKEGETCIPSKKAKNLMQQEEKLAMLSTFGCKVL
jgi:hypothetical protein